MKTKGGALKCAKCGMQATEWKCAVCGDESKEHIMDHTHGEPASNRHMMPKCDGCDKAEVHCDCDASEPKTNIA